MYRQQQAKLRPELLALALHEQLDPLREPATERLDIVPPVEVLSDAL